MHYMLICTICFVLRDKEIRMERTFYNVICEELELLGGKVIHIDKNFGDMNEVHNFVISNIGKYPNAHWELRPIIFKI